MDARDQGIRWSRAISWGIYLAVSWTWCIGMFLPILLLRDFGVPGYIAFALPNVLGAAAMGWIMTSPDASRQFVERHRLACIGFGAVTVLFHLVFALKVIAPINELGGAALGAASVLLAPLLLSWLDRPRAVALITYVLSLCAASVFVSQAWIPAPELDPAATESLRSMRLGAYDVAFLTPACAFGFLFCPYLDLTFHRARQGLAGVESRLGFGIGFGVFFLAMILFTVAYAPVFAPDYSTTNLRPHPLLLSTLLLHIGSQSAATIAFHLRALRVPEAGAIGKDSSKILMVLALACGGSLLLAQVRAWSVPSFADPHQRLIWYRVFMSFYGLVFPGYIWLLAIPTRDGHAGPRGSQGRRKLTTLFIALLLASPCFWLGFVERQTWWLAPGMLVILGSRLFVTPRSHRLAH